jgi:hypothetical protein
VEKSAGKSLEIPAEFPETRNPQEISLNGKIRSKNLRNTCRFFSAGKSAGNKQIFSSVPIFTILKN